MVKSFLTIDVQGRVVRLDTFSKTLAPGARLGWFTGSKMFIERLLRGTEVQTQMPSGISSVSWTVLGVVLPTANTID
jgi:aromatic amino acid aminotransferase I